MTERDYHYTIGGGSVGCLYDYGPEVADTLDNAIDSLDQIYDLTTAERNQLRWHKHLAFDATPGTAEDTSHDPQASRREEAGADYCEICEQDGPCPDSDD
jgi:hypothetical protein